MKVIEFLTNENFLIPFLSTAGASLTVIFLQFIKKVDTNREEKLYAINFMADVCFRLLSASIIIKKHTIIPHIKATQQILEGDEELINTMFLADEFDVLTDEQIEFDHLPNEYKVLIGRDDMELLQAFEMVLYFSKLNKTKNSFNSYVKENLKSQHGFTEKSPEEKTQILMSYWDYLDKLKGEKDRIISFILYIVKPLLEKYITKKSFLFYSKKNIKQLLDSIDKVKKKYKEMIPGSDHIEKSIHDGIQKIIRTKGTDLF